MVDIPVTPERITDVLIEDEMKESYLNYAMSVIVSRALPDSRDGLKPSQRRILVAMNDLSLGPRAKYKKCAKIAGDTSGNYHPHGESVVYPTLVRMAQDFNMRYTLIEGQGNFGSIDGDPPAAMRYTEARMRAPTEEMLADLKMETVDYVPNYDETRQEPTVLPAKFPNLLCNGATGIAVGMATSMAPHNLREVVAGLIHLIDNPECAVEDLMKFVKGPDFPTSAIICGRAGIKSAYKTGRGRVVVRARAHFEQLRGNRSAIIFTELPYQVNKLALIEKIAELVKTEALTGIADIRDESDKKGIRVFVEVKRGEDEKVILNQLYKHTSLQSTFSIINISLVNGRPETLNLKEMMVCYRNHRMEVIRRRTRYLLRKAEERAHILEGYLIALDHIDEIIKIIRKAESPDVAKTQLMTKFKLSEIQATHILDMQLRRLTGLERIKIEEEYEQKKKEIADYKDILANERRVLDIIVEDLKEMEERFGDPRRTVIVDGDVDIDIEDMIADETVVVTMTHSGYLKRLPINTYRKQHRGGKGVNAMGMKEGDWIADIFIAQTKDYILYFTNLGKVYWLKVYEIPEMSRTSRGKHIVNILEMEKDETVCAYIRVRDFDERELIVVTKHGVVKKTALSEYSRPKRTGIRAIVVDEGDEVIDVKLTSGDGDVILGTAHGMSIRFNEKDARSQGRVTRGVRGITLREGDSVIGIAIPNKAGTLLTICENGYGKRTEYDEYRIQKRGGMGVIDIKTTERNGDVIALMNVISGDEIMGITKNGMLIRTEISDESIRTIGRNTQGVRIMKLDSSDKLIGVAPVMKEESEAAARKDSEEDDDSDFDGEESVMIPGLSMSPDEKKKKKKKAIDKEALLKELDDEIDGVEIPEPKLKFDDDDDEPEDEPDDEDEDLDDDDEGDDE
ncbi:MAG: DNA gyrase subunit A [Planctomycetes bacterium]|nr:DNA gyrase subunit A [Planctomycetota bacterium]